MGEPNHRSAAVDPHAAYATRLTRRREQVASLRRAGETLSYVRLGVFGAGGIAAWLSLFSDLFAWPWLLVPLAAFLALVILHDRVIRRRVRAARAAAFYERGLGRLEDRWAGRGNLGDRFLDTDHPYAGDLDLFGRGSLFELLCAARTLSGERTLARWLREPAPPGEIRERQQAVEELRPLLDLREELALLGEEVSSTVDPDELAHWAEAPPLLTSRALPLAAALLAVTNVTGLMLWATTPVGAVPFVLSAACAIALATGLRSRVQRVLGTVERRERELEILSLILRRLERERFRAPLLVRLRAELETRGKPPSRRIAQLARLVELNESRRNMIFQPLAALLLLGMQLAFAVERWRAVAGDGVARWLAAVGEMEALSSIAGYAFENPGDPFPVVEDGGARFEGTELGHPLLPRSRCVRNDVVLGEEPRLLVVSGSNMSGKSTLLRTVGVNAVLAQAGAPVRAAALRLSPLAIGASMRLQDSLQEGMSHFYAEVKRLRQVVDLGGAGRPLLFLLDEILHGTNSHDRRVGADALVDGLLRRGAIGMITTHDLALAEIADRRGKRAANVHFQDHLEGDRIAFDFKLRPGVVGKGNALALMRSAGLEV